MPTAEARDRLAAERKEVNMTMLVKPPSFFEFDAMERRLRRMLEGVGFAPAMLPAADVYELEKEWVVELEVPGYEEKELELELSDHVLTVKGSREQVTDESEKSFRLHERLEREFERTFALPPDVDTEHVTAKFEKGVLEVHAPKLSITEPRKVAISA
jgi:HSP20 family protein